MNNEKKKTQFTPNAFELVYWNRQHRAHFRITKSPSSPIQMVVQKYLKKTTTNFWMPILFFFVINHTRTNTHTHFAHTAQMMCVWVLECVCVLIHTHTHTEHRYVYILQTLSFWCTFFFCSFVLFQFFAFTSIKRSTTQTNKQLCKYTLHQRKIYRLSIVAIFYLFHAPEKWREELKK